MMFGSFQMEPRNEVMSSEGWCFSLSTGSHKSFLGPMIPSQKASGLSATSSTTSSNA